MASTLRTLSPFLLFFIAFCTPVLAQQSRETTVSFRISSSAGEPISGATVMVISVPDSLQQQQSITDSNGIATFRLRLGKHYAVTITSVNHEPVQKTITITKENSFFTLVATASGKLLGSVIVTGSRPIMRQEDDKTIVDPENLANSSTNAYEIMEKIPGLFVDQDGNIYLNSTTPATVYINGREQKMSATDLATILKSLPPNAIASIEILRTPSARYDASSSGGIVNVVLRKGVRIGITGSINAGMNQGKYGNQFVGFNLNNSNGAFTSYLNVQASRRNTYEQIKTDRIFSPDSLLSQDALTKYPALSAYVGYGFGYQFSKKWELNYDGRLSYNKSKNGSTNLSGISTISTAKLVTSNLTDVNTRGRTLNINQGISLKYKIDSAGSEWTTDLSYSYAPNNTDQDFVTSFQVPQRSPISGDGNLSNDLHFISGQTNLNKKISKQLTLEAGLKATHVIFHNTTDYFRINGGNRIKDEVRTGAYDYHETINAAYVQASRNFSGIIVKLGTRVENTNMSGAQLVPGDTSFSIHRTDLFPYIYLSRPLMKIAGYELKAYLVYRRTITRPTYDLLSPSVRYVDPYLFETGNPSLRPQFNQNYEANISVDERPIVAIGTNTTQDIFTQVVYQADSSKSTAFRTWDNLGRNKEIYFRALGAIPPGKRYFLVAGTQYNHNFYEGLYQGKPLQFKRGSWTFFTYQTFKLFPLTQLTLNGFARFNGQLQFYELSQFGALNFSISQQLMKKKLTLSLSVNDIFYTNRNEFTIQQGGMSASGFRKSDTRRLGLNIRYNFGLRKKEENNLLNVEPPEKSN